MPVEKGDRIKVEYEGTLEDGSVFDSSKNVGEPLEFTAGGQQVIPGFDNAVMGMEVGDKKTITLQPEEAYGDYDPERTQAVPKDSMPEEIEVGSILLATLPGGQQVPVKVAEIDSEKNEVTLDVNHPFAGKVLNFEITLVEICPDGPVEDGCDCC